MEYSRKPTRFSSYFQTHSMYPCILQFRKPGHPATNRSLPSGWFAFHQAHLKGFTTFNFPSNRLSIMQIFTVQSSAFTFYSGCNNQAIIKWILIPLMNGNSFFDGSKGNFFNNESAADLTAMFWFTAAMVNRQRCTVLMRWLRTEPFRQSFQLRSWRNSATFVSGKSYAKPQTNY